MAHILVVEDDKSLNKSICLFLQQRGFIPQACFDGEEAFQLLYKHSFDIILCDIMMPVVDGFQLINHVRQLNKEIPIIMMTAKEDFQSKALATQAVLDAVRDRGLKACVVHPSGILGPEDFAVGETTSTMIQIINGEMPAGINGSFNLCDVRDLARGTILAATKGKSGHCYILGNKEVSFKDFSRMVSQEAGCKKNKTLPSPKTIPLFGRPVGKTSPQKGNSSPDDYLQHL